MTDLIKTRSDVKKRKPTYKRVQANQFAKFKNDPKWRRPKGMGNKDRRNRKGHIGTLKVGYGSPAAISGANKDGLFEVIVSNVSDLANVKEKNQVGVISATVGGKKKLDILKAAKDKKMSIANVKDIDKAIESLTKAPKKKETKKAAAKPAKAETKKEEAKK